MNARTQTVARWALVLVTFWVTSCCVFVFLMGFMLWPDRSMAAASLALGLRPGAAIEAAHRIDFFVAFLIWIVPTTCAAGFAMRRAQRGAIQVAICLSLLLFATLSFFLGRSDRSVALQTVSVVAALVAVAALSFSIIRTRLSHYLTSSNIVVTILLFGPSLIALNHRSGNPPEAKSLWSVTLRQEQWQSMNTGSEYAATRQVAIVGDRVVAVFDAGFAPSQPPRDKWPLSTYQLVSLDANSGAKRNEITFTGRWGTMPYVYSTQTGLIDVQSDPPRKLNPDLTAFATPNSAASTTSLPKQEPPACGTLCGPSTYILSANSFIRLEPKRFTIVDKAGHVLGEGPLLQWGSFAGASADGQRFAIDSSYTEGDPDFVVYEYFMVYSSNGKALATIHVKDLPARQSWSAFSPDGRHFVAGSPNKLTMYQLP